MCPACMATVAVIAAGATSTGGLAALVVKTFRAKRNATKILAVPKSKEKRS